MNSSLFGTSGIRGDAEKLFTDQFSFDLGRTFAKFLDYYHQDGAIAIGMDPRGSSPRIKEHLSSGLVYEGRKVYDEGSSPVPSINYILKISDYICGSIMVSGSHIKDYLNGVKFFAFNEEISKDHEKKIEGIYFGLKDKIKSKTLDRDKVEYEQRANDEYKEYLPKLASNYPSWIVVVDPGDGAQSDTMPEVLKNLGLKIIEINATIQGKFFARDTEAESEFADLKSKVKEYKADIGIGYDADGDRCVFVDHLGNFIPGDFTCTLIAREISGDKVVTPVSTSQVIDQIGKTVIRTKIGSPYVVEAMRKNNASFGFEANGGGIFTDMHSRDGGRVTIEVLNIMAKYGKSLNELISELPRYYILRDKIEYDWKYKDAIIKAAKLKYKGIKVEELDGLKIWIDKNTWILFRSSANAPEFRIFAESDIKEKSEKLLRDGVAFVKSVI